MPHRHVGILDWLIAFDVFFLDYPQRRKWAGYPSRSWAKANILEIDVETLIPGNFQSQGVVVWKIP